MKKSIKKWHAFLNQKNMEQNSIKYLEKGNKEGFITFTHTVPNLLTMLILADPFFIGRQQNLCKQFCPYNS